MRVRDGRLRHVCQFPRWLTGDSQPIVRGDEHTCLRCGQVWVALTNRPHNNPRNGDWRKLRAGLLRRPVRHSVEGRDGTEKVA